MKQKIKYWEPRVMRHTNGDVVEYAIHDVYFDVHDTFVTCTTDALSPREISIEELRNRLVRMLEGNDTFIVSGDLQYSYPREDVEYWLEMVASTPMDYPVSEI